MPGSLLSHNIRRAEKLGATAHLARRNIVAVQTRGSALVTATACDRCPPSNTSIDCTNVALFTSFVIHLANIPCEASEGSRLKVNDSYSSGDT